MAVSDAHLFPGFLTPVLTQLLFPKPPTTFLTCFCRGETQKYDRKKVCLSRGSNSQPSGQESDTLTTEPPGQGISKFNEFADNNLNVTNMLRFVFDRVENMTFPTTFQKASSSLTVITSLPHNPDF